MTHHLLPEIDREWLGAVTNCFLIRDPHEVINSYIKKREDPALEDLGFVQQAEIFDFVRTHTNAVPPVVDAKDVLQNPEGTLRLLCEAVGVEFSKSMLSWPSGLRDTDGIWAKHWYGEVAKTTSFQPYRPTVPRCQSACANFTNAAANAMSGCTNTDCVRKQATGLKNPFLLSWVPD